jgi:hypothetical protein
VNGEPLKELPASDSYVKIHRVWRQGDTVELNLPKMLRTEPLPDNSGRMAVLWGPLVIAGDLGPEVHEEVSQDNAQKMPAPSAPALVMAKAPVEQWLKPEAGKPGWFKTSSVGLAEDIHFAPLYQLPRRKYAVYWDVFTPDEWTKHLAESKAEEEKQHLRQSKLEAATIAVVQPGETQSDRDFHEQGEDTAPLLWQGRHGRGGKGWFSFDLPVVTSQPVALYVTYGGNRWQESTVDILVEGKNIGHHVELNVSPDREKTFVDASYVIPAELIAGKSKVTVRFQAADGSEIGGIFGVRTVRADEAP